jgi:two-component system chemotaxis response regulator CheB
MTPGARTRILIVDDSAVVRNLLRQVIAQDSTMEVAGTAASGEAVPALVSSLHPDLLLLDVEMPRMGGLEALKDLRARGDRMPVVMCSSLTQRGAQVTIEALAAGASDYVAKPFGQRDAQSAVQALSRDLLPKIRALTLRSPMPLTLLPARSAPMEESWDQEAAVAPAVVVVGVSTGGPQALDAVLPALPKDFPVPVLVVQHMPEVFTATLAARLNERSRIRVCEAVEGELLRPGAAYIARGNWHMEVLPAARAGMAASLHLTKASPENYCRPSVDVTLRSAASAFGAAVLAVQLTGMGSDGLQGCRTVRAQGGTVLAQDEATSAVWGMPGAVVQAGLAQRVLPIQKIASFLTRLTAPSLNELPLGRDAVS